MAYKVIFTNGTKHETILETKGINPFNDDRPGAWSPDPSDVREQAQATRLVPSMFAGVSARQQAMADLPFTIYSFNGDKTIDDSDDYHNAIGILPAPAAFLSLAEGALVCAGSAYWHKNKGKSTGKTKLLQYWNPDSVTLDPLAAQRGEVIFKRVGTSQTFPADEVLYVWGLDPYVELGPPTVYPFASAVTAAQASGAITQWAADYMKRGAIKAMMLMVDGMPPPAEVERMENWFNRFMSGAKSLAWKVFNSAGVKPTIIGDGLEALRDMSVSADLRREIHMALGTRHLLEDENFATAQARERQFYTITIMPDARLIQQALNEQILHAAGYHFEFEPERLECFQEDEGAQAQAFGQLFTVFKEVLPPDVAFKLAAEKLDYGFTDEQQAMIKKGLNEKKQPAEAAPVDTQPETPAPTPNPEIAKALIELDKWESKVNAAAGNRMTWHAVSIPPDVVKRLKAGEVTFDEARRAVYAMNTDSIKALADAIEKAVARG